MEIERELRRAKQCQIALLRHGVKDRACTMVLYTMLSEGMLYRDALDCWAEYELGGIWAPERWHSEICYALLRAGLQVHPDIWFGQLVGEVAALEN